MARRRHIAVIAPPWYPLPPQGYGGTELVVHLLVQSLRKFGVRVTLYGCEGSAPGTTVMAGSGWWADFGFHGHHMRQVTYSARVMNHLEQLEDVDLIHDHAEWLSTAMCSFANLAPVVHTVHGPLEEPRVDAYEALGDRTNLVAISRSQRSGQPDLNWAGTVFNAVDVDNLYVATRADKEGYLLCLARITLEKGQHLAIEAARRVGKRIVLAGKVGELPQEREYFERRIKPLIDDDNVVYIDNIVGEQKARIIARADALLHAVTFPEPFGLAMVEAMASGTPCIAIARGAAPELITHGRTGFLCQDVDEMVESLGRIREIDLAACAAEARSRFHPDQMAQGYMGVYEEVVGVRAPKPAAVPPLLQLAGRTPVAPPVPMLSGVDGEESVGVLTG
jgi:glycosyltransferase involved in cell wall biosynthesis